MFTPISLYNLLEGGWRSLLSVLGIGIAIVLIFMQLGFLGAVLDTAVVFYRNLKFDLVVRSPEFYRFVDSKTIRREFLDRISSVEGVDHIQPFHVSIGMWTLEEQSIERTILILGVNSRGQTFQSQDPQVILPDVSKLFMDRAILVDRKSRPIFLGRKNRRSFSDQEDVGRRVEINQKLCEIAGTFRLGTGLAADGAIVINEHGFLELVPGYSEEDVAFGLIQLSPDSSLDHQAARNRILAALGAEAQPVEVLTRREVENREIRFWLMNTPVGLIFITGVVVAFIVGAIIVYIVLSSDITRQLSEYATLKAMGYRNVYLSRIVLEQALILGVISYVLAYFTALFLYRIVGDLAQLPINMTVNRQLLVFGSTMLMCSLSGAIALQKLRKAEPADLF